MLHGAQQQAHLPIVAGRGHQRRCNRRAGVCHHIGSVGACEGPAHIGSSVSDMCSHTATQSTALMPVQGMLRFVSTEGP